MKIAMILILSGAILLVVGFVVKAFSFRKWMRTGRTVTYEGFLAHVMPRLTKRLALSTEQQEKVKALAQRTIAKVRTLRLDLAERRAKWTPPAPRYERGYGWMFTKHIEQANDGCDFDFLRTDFGGPVPEPEIN